MCGMCTGLEGAVAPHSGQLDHMVLHVSAESEWKSSVQVSSSEQTGEGDAAPIELVAQHPESDQHTADQTSSTGVSWPESHWDRSSNSENEAAPPASSPSSQQLLLANTSASDMLPLEAQIDCASDKTFELIVAALPGPKRSADAAHPASAHAALPHSTELLHDHAASQAGRALSWVDALLGALSTYPATAKHLLISLVLQPRSAGAQDAADGRDSLQPDHTMPRMHSPSHEQPENSSEATMLQQRMPGQQALPDWVQRLRPKQSFQSVRGQEMAVADLEPARLIQCLPGIIRWAPAKCNGSEPLCQGVHGQVQAQLRLIVEFIGIMSAKQDFHGFFIAASLAFILPPV